MVSLRGLHELAHRDKEVRRVDVQGKVILASSFAKKYKLSEIFKYVRLFCKFLHINQTINIIKVFIKCIECSDVCLNYMLNIYVVSSLMPKQSQK